jgi:hypothetical protein
MDDKKGQFDQYEFIGLIVPGTVALLVGAAALGNVSLFSELEKISVGGFGVVVILAYVTGHVADMIGTWIETLWWRISGMPTDRIIRGTASGFNAEAMTMLNGQIEKWFGLHPGLPRKDMSKADSYTLTRRIYATVAAAGMASRTDAFLRTYGLMRSLMGAFLILSFIAVANYFGAIGPRDFDSGSTLRAALAFFVAACVAFSRMTYFGRTYARELFVQFMQIGNPKP